MYGGGEEFPVAELYEVKEQIMPRRTYRGVLWDIGYLAGWLLTSAGAPLLGAPAPEGRPFTTSIGMELVWLPMGYWVGKTEVVQEQYLAVMSVNPSRWPGARRPVENVDWHEATRFCEQLTVKESAAGGLPDGWHFSLPTEQQWEYFVGDARLEDMVHARWEKLIPLGTQSVASLTPNQYGLCDVRGNVWEWCSDWLDHKKIEKVLRGGSWDLVHPADLDVTYRPVSAAVARNGNIGFRVVAQKDMMTNHHANP